MNKKLILSMAIIVLVFIAVGGATLAFFTAKAELDNTFTAGKVLIGVDETNVEGGDIGNVNPGDCLTKVIEIENEGSKRIYLRLRMAEDSDWDFDWDYLWDNWDALCFSEHGDRPAKPSGEWDAFVGLVEQYLATHADDLVTTKLLPGNGYSVQGPDTDGWFYIVPDPLVPLEAGAKLTVNVEVCFNGPLMLNYFQAATYTHYLTFEAVQYSNDAPFYEWDVPYYGTPTPAD